jgi:hypothetical protein
MRSEGIFVCFENQNIVTLHLLVERKIFER